MQITIIVLLTFTILIQTIHFFYIKIKFNKILKPCKEQSISHNPDSKFKEISWNTEVKRTMELQCMSVRNAVQKQTVEIHKKEIELAPREPSLTSDQIKDVYSTEQIKTIQLFWLEYEN